MERETTLRRRHGFEGISPERRREIASLGGKAAQKTGRTHRWTSEEAQEAGRKGGRANLGVKKTYHKKRKKWMVATEEVQEG